MSAAAVFFLSSATFAAGSKSVAVFVEGADADAVAAEIQSVLPPELGSVDAKTFGDALRKAGQSAPMGNTLAVKGTLRDKIFARVQKALETTAADAAVLGRVRMGKLGKEVWIVWLSSSGSVEVDQAVSLKGDDHRADFGEALQTPANALVPPPSSSGSNTDPTLGGSGSSSGGGPDDSSSPGDEPKKDASSRTPHVAGSSLFSITAAFEVGGRNAAFTDAVSPNIRPYQVYGAPMVHVAGEVFPAATTGIPVLKNIGLAARFSMALGLSSNTTDKAASTGNTWYRFRGGLKWRFVPGSDSGPVLALTGDFGIDSFSFDDAGDLADSVPTVNYQYLRAGGEVYFPIGPVGIGFNGGYRGLLSVGETGDRFRDTSAMAFDAGALFVVGLPKGFDIRLAGEYTRVFYAFDPVLGDAYVAGGMTDEMFGARLGVGYVY
ncbi:MAG: hypothetical protein IPK82_34675 [Polyangiaceae bacterium]|nr:hypothetical protein [Polyangiaceae bacterium]